MDAARGVASVIVLLQHTIEQMSPAYLAWSLSAVRPGETGVVLFFIVSGFIIPVSLDRYRSVAGFWIGRFWRLFPLYWALLTVAIAVQVLLRGSAWLPPRFTDGPVSGVLANASMMQQFLGWADGKVIGSSWTLAYELAFYAMVTMLFLMGWSGRPERSFGLWLVIAVVAGPVLPALLLTGPHSPARTAFVVAATALVAGCAAWLTSGGRRRLLAAGISVVTVPLILNQPERFWFSSLLFASMFLGSVIYQWTRGERTWRAPVGASVLFALTAVVLTRTQIDPHVEPVTGALLDWRPEAVTLVGALLLFWVFVAMRRVRFPRWMTWLGTISYSIYLLHAVVLMSVPPTWSWLPDVGIDHRVLTVVVWCSLTIALSAVTYRWIEEPFHRYGQGLARKHRGPAAPA